MQKKVPYVAQLGNMDCSIACMTMLFRYYGLDVDIVDVGQVVHIGRDGVNLTQLKQATQQFGFKCTAYAVKTMQSHKYLQNPCVCHGIAGNAEILLTYGQQFQDQIASSTAKHFYSRLVGSVNSGTFECSRPYLYGFNIPGFMTGLAGIGYSLLRLLDPTLPSVLQINI